MAKNVKNGQAKKIKNARASRASNSVETEVGEGQLVLRTVFIPTRLDQFLRDLAGQERVSKGEIIRRAIGYYRTNAVSH